MSILPDRPADLSDPKVRPRPAETSGFLVVDRVTASFFFMLCWTVVNDSDLQRHSELLPLCGCVCHCRYFTVHSVLEWWWNICNQTAAVTSCRSTEEQYKLRWKIHYIRIAWWAANSSGRLKLHQQPQISGKNANVNYCKRKKKESVSKKSRLKKKDLIKHVSYVLYSSVIRPRVHLQSQWVQYFFKKLCKMYCLKNWEAKLFGFFLNRNQGSW